MSTFAHQLFKNSSQHKIIINEHTDMLTHCKNQWVGIQYHLMFRFIKPLWLGFQELGKSPHFKPTEYNTDTGLWVCVCVFDCVCGVCEHILTAYLNND